ncbi:hypothetical protein NZD89_20350 [Alicyclobacillus fastidiosus]|uniref:Uncharacterized protein n=1 Tax=Alicyclobacillus fastidiosus TaxID=392011 RepID=A0ABY6ZEH2_9BACL|nr:hypothetical protein [Alicyclobacillus fastidiosus]WAH40641.1 hypothetical protein NZD89_20350 [Alicyclobacillus fastidiosus]GMA62088.1 hypothetical protein GCM10025859_25280 [Alicyclobacillus fastidiosus]
MSSDNHLLNAGKTIVKGIINVSDALSEKRYLDATENAWESSLETVKETGTSAIETVKALTGEHCDKH